MANDRISITFEPNVPVAGQILILEAVDYLYSLAALMYVGWSHEAARIPDWHKFIVNSPGKLLAEENTLRVHSAHSSAVTEVVEGIDKAIKQLKKLVDMLKQLREEERAKSKLQVIREELLPLIEKLRQQGASEERIRLMVENAALYVDEVLIGLMTRDKLKLEIKD